MQEFLAGGSTYREQPGSRNGFDLTSFIKDILVESGIIPDPDECCVDSRHVFISKGLIGKGTLNLKKILTDILVEFGFDVDVDCCDPKHNISKTIISNRGHYGYLSLRQEIRRVLNHYGISFFDDCCVDYNDIEMNTFLGNNTLSYPVGVFNVNGDFIDVADNQDEYVTVWNSDSFNQSIGTLFPGNSPLTFKISEDSILTEVIGLRYYEYTGPANVEIFVGDNDIIKYGSTTKKGNIDGTNITTTTRQEWNRNLFSGGGQNDSTIEADDVRVLVCTGYLDSELLRVFHNEDSEYAGVSQTTGYYSIGGNFPTGLKATYYRGRTFVTDYNNILNWNELTQYYSWYTNSSGGVPWGFNPPFFPTALFGSTVLRQIGIGQDNFSPASILADYPYLTSDNFPVLEDLVIHLNTGDGLSAAVSWFLTMPKVTNLFYYQTQTVTQSSAAVADDIWNNVAIALSGVIPTGAAKKLRIIRTNNVTAASLASRNALISAGWTVLTN